jgi:hypothetical protein
VFREWEGSRLAAAADKVEETPDDAEEGEIAD